ncbi:hypothetical protein [Caballeronia sp. NCTM5]|uniref:hypothetical protein n=1 Tax=Caballeronia sp. NCTM5 TaxID=2921755 RepID=UPI002028227E|nr:hypothetical protein [Caballeronia sp. NCTM5]
MTAMTLPNYLTVAPNTAEVSVAETFCDVGFSLKSLRRPTQPLASWMAEDDLPVRARSVLSSQDSLSDAKGLVRVALNTKSANHTKAGWILARAASGLLSIVVREARDTSVAQVIADFELAITQADCFCAAQAVLLLQTDVQSMPMASQQAMQNAFANPCIRLDELYPAPGDGVQAWYGILSAP